jgi:hypothetical protein
LTLKRTWFNFGSLRYNPSKGIFMKRLISLVAIVILTNGSSLMAGETKASGKPAPDPNREVCKRIQPVGTLFAKKLCKTAREWQIEEELAQDTMKRSKVENSPGAN